MTARIGWKIYFFFITALTAFGVAFAIAGPFFLDDVSTQWWEWFFIPLYIVQIVALYGVVYWHKIASPPFWKSLFILSVAEELWNNYSLYTDPEMHWNDPEFFFPVLIICYFLLQAPLWIGIYLYAFRCKELWTN